MSIDPRTSALVAFLAFAVAAGAGCGGGGDGPSGPDPSPSSVFVNTSTAPPPLFSPAEATVAVGGSVTWRNVSPAAHDLTSTTSNWQLAQPLAVGETFELAFQQAGTFGYRCTIHPGMNGSIVVQ